MGFVQPVQDAGQGLAHRRSLKRHFVGNAQHVHFNDATRDFDVLRIGAVVKQQVFT